MKYRAITLLLLVVIATGTGYAKKPKGLVSFQFYGSQWSVRVSEQLHFAEPDTTSFAVFDTLSIERHIKDTFDDCIALKARRRLNDWAYMKMLDSLSVASFGTGNEATLMKTYLMAKSGYDIILLRDKNILHIGYYSKYTVYRKPYITTDGKNYYLDVDKAGTYKVSSFRCKGKPVSFELKVQPLLDRKNSQKRIFETSKEFCTRRHETPLSIEVSVNQNLMDFYAQYPNAEKNYDFTTRWALMANVPLDDDVKKQIYPSLRKQLEGLSQYDAVNKLLHFVQTSLDWAYDDDVWGHDRAFFAEETLFYPSNDSEDRVILLSRLIRDLLDMEVVILFFPGHLSMAVRFDEDIEGACVIYNSDRFVICDPSYIGSDIGEPFPQFADQDPERMILLYR